MHHFVDVEPDTKQDEPAIPARDGRERELVAIIREFIHELHPRRSKIMEVSIASRLERDLGIDSLGRTELILRIERSFGVRLPGAAAGAAGLPSKRGPWWKSWSGTQPAILTASI
ncbi:MAG: acyl carrier protein [Rhodomicrobium sp.]